MMQTLMRRYLQRSQANRTFFTRFEPSVLLLRRGIVSEEVAELALIVVSSMLVQSLLVVLCWRFELYGGIDVVVILQLANKSFAG